MSENEDQNRIKITMVAPANNPHTIKFAKALVDLGYKLKIISWAPGQIDDIEVYVHSQIQPELKGIWKKIETIKDYGEIRKRLQWADIVFVNFIYNWRFNEIYRGIDNIVVLLWGSDISYNESETPEQVKYKKLILSLADRVLAFSKWLAGEAQQYLPDGVDAEVLPVGVRMDLFHPGGRKYTSERTVVIGYAKGLDVKYGPEYLIKACEYLKNEGLNYKCKIAGSGNQEIILKKMVEELDLGDRVEFVGWLPPDAVPDFMREIDVFVMPSVWRESFGIAALEASASGVPVVASNIGGISEAVWDNETGILVQPESAEDLALALKALIQSPDLRSCMGAQGRDYIKFNYRWEDTIKRLNEVFLEVLEKKKNNHSV